VPRPAWAGLAVTTLTVCTLGFYNRRPNRCDVPPSIRRVQTLSSLRLRIATTVASVGLALAGQVGGAPVAFSASASRPASTPAFSPNNLVVSRSVYQGTADTVRVGQLLPPNCPATAKCGGPNGTGVPATDNGLYPAIGSMDNVWNNNKVDGSFGVTAPIFLDQLSPRGALLNTLAIDPTQITTSFSSKSELAVNLSTDGTAVTFMGYATAPNTLDASNSNTPGVVDSTNPVGENIYRAVAQVDASGTLRITDTNAYSGNNGRAAILANGLYYAVGNDNNGSGASDPLIKATGVELIVPGAAPGTPQMVGDFSIRQYGYPADKPGKDNNFRGLTVFDNTLYVTKGSGGNGINTVYQVGDTGHLPDLASAATTPITILPGLPTTPAKNTDAQNPFGLFFADADTLYVADEGDGVAADAATSPNAGLQKWVRTGGVWQRVYVLQSGLNLGKSYGVDGYPAALDPAPDGLRNLTGRVNVDGTVDIWAATSTVSANGDQGADPNQLVFVTDKRANTSPAVAASEQFAVLRTARSGEVLRGVSFAPGVISQSPGTGSTCDGVYRGGFSGNLQVSAGQNCVFVGGVIDGSVQVNGGSLMLSNTTVDGNVQVSGGGTVDIGPAATINGNLQIRGGSAGGGLSEVCDTRIAGNVQVRDTGGEVRLGSSSPTCAGNAIGGALQCYGNVSLTGGAHRGPVLCGRCLVVDGDVRDGAQVDLRELDLEALDRDSLDVPDAGIGVAAVEAHLPGFAGIEHVFSEDVVAPARVGGGRHVGVLDDVVAVVVQVEVAPVREGGGGHCQDEQQGASGGDDKASSRPGHHDGESFLW